MKKYSRKEGFTLIELLVVISIISLLSTIVLATVNNARSRATVASSQQFSVYNQQALGAYATGWWNFDEVSGNALDGSGNSNDLTFTGTGATRENITTYNSKGSAYAGATGGYLLDSTVSNQPTGSMAYAEGWIYIRDINDLTDSAYNGIVGVGDPSVSHAFFITLSKSGANAILGMGTWGVGNDLTSTGIIIPFTTWTHVAVSLNGKAATIYVNGKIAYSGNITTTPQINQQAGPGKVVVGCMVDLGRCFTGYIDDVRIYQQPIALKEIEEHYAEGLKTHQFAIRK